MPCTWTSLHWLQILANNYLSWPQNCYEKCIMKKLGFCKVRGRWHHQSEMVPRNTHFSGVFFLPCHEPGYLSKPPIVPSDISPLTSPDAGTSIPEVPFFQQKYHEKSHTKMKMALGGLLQWCYLPVRTTLLNRTLRRWKKGQVCSEIRTGVYKQSGTQSTIKNRQGIQARSPEELWAAGKHFEGME